MHDIQFIRHHSDEFDNGLKKRGISHVNAAEILEIDRARRELQTKLQAQLSKRNALSKTVGMKKAKGENADQEIAEVSALKIEIPELEKEEQNLAKVLKEWLESLPNLPLDDVPEGEDEGSNYEIRRVGTVSDHLSSLTPKAHDQLGVDLKMLDFEQAAHISGARFVVMKSALARMERALAAFMLDVHTQENGYTEMIPPFLVRDQAMYGTGQLPKFSEDLFHTEEGFWLIPTAEVPLTNMVAGKIVDYGELPLRMTAWTPCFRSEAGAAGRDTRGMIRQHQFSKVELVSIVAPEHGIDELERMTACAEMILQRLELPYRVMLLSTGDMGFGAQKTYDLEVWLPEQNCYREISSCSFCGSFQARRMNGRFRRQGAKGTEFLATLNGSGLAVGRTLVAIMENYQQTDGSIAVPKALQPYMGGLAKIEPF